LSIQVLLATVAALIVFGWQREMELALAALYGGGIAIVNTLLLARRTSRAAVLAEGNLKWSALTLYAGMLERLIFTGVAFAVGLAARPAAGGFRGRPAGLCCRRRQAVMMDGRFTDILIARNRGHS